ncbi:MAG: anthranilate synthase component I family protein [Myxococcales bacterium]
MFLTRSQLGLSPGDAARRLGNRRGLAWLDGGLTHGQEGRFSFVGCEPVEVVERCFGDPKPLSVLDGLVRQPRVAGADGATSALPEVQAEDVPAWIGHIAYDSLDGGHRESLVRHRQLPCLHFARYAALYGFDHARGLGFLVGDSEAACADLEGLLAAPAAAATDCEFTAGPVLAGSPERHADNVRAALERIAAGDVYEVNLARRFRAAFHGQPLGLFLRMRAQSPVPFGYFVNAGSHALLGRSMERFLRYRRCDRALWTSPIKGTIASTGDGAREASALLANPKEHAEHAMVVDLMRNDLSRVSEAGSVHVRELMRVLPFAGLSHLVSTVESRARKELSVSQILSGTFPPGSVTGAPKESAMRIIAALEEAPRGFYTGAVGFLDRAGGFSFSVTIRTAVVHGGHVEYCAGGGIVIDSDPLAETLETELKAQAFLRALSP